MLTKAATVRDLKRDSGFRKDLVPNRQQQPNVRFASVTQTDLTYMVVYLSILQSVTAFLCETDVSPSLGECVREERRLGAASGVRMASGV